LYRSGAEFEAVYLRIVRSFDSSMVACSEG